jgi:hypothetical protein
VGTHLCLYRPGAHRRRHGVYNVTDPYAPTIVQYLNNRDFGAEPDTPEAGDLGAEGLTVIEASKSPIRGVPC